MDILKGMRVFIACVEGHSFVAAARRLGVSGAAVSRQVAALEAHVGARLFNRSTRSLSLTEAGEQFFARASHLIAEIEEVSRISYGDQGRKPGGLLRVSAPMSFGLRKLGTLIPDFLRRYPDIRLDIDPTDRIIDLVAEGFDVALRINPPGAMHDVIMRRIASIRVTLTCTPEYLERSAPVTSPADLAAREILNYSHSPGGQIWSLRGPTGSVETVRVAPKVVASNGDLLRDIALDYGGIILQPAFIVEDDIASGRLVEILPGWRIDPSELCAVYPSRKYLPAKVRVFIDYLVEKLSE